MRKRLIIINSLIIFFSLLTALVCFTLSLKKENTVKSEGQIRDYLSISQTSLKQNLAFEEKNQAIKDTAEMLNEADSAIRVTVIDTSGAVLFDTSKEEISENHLLRPEIQNLGTIYYRYSATLGKNMMYLAGLDASSSYYVRLSMPQYDINKLVDDMVLYGSLATLGIFILSVLSVYGLTRKAFAPLKEEADRLSYAVGSTPEENPHKDEAEVISDNISRASDLIQAKVKMLTEEKQKSAFILDTLKDGLAVFDADLNILMINRALKNVFHENQEAALEGQPFSRLTVDQKINQALQKAQYGQDSSFSWSYEEGKCYLVSCYAIKKAWCSKEDRYGVGLNLADISAQQNLALSKRDFFANASHELKSPLTSIIGYAELLQQGLIDDPKEMAESAERIKAEGKRMNEIIIQMLELSRLESENVKTASDISLLSSVQEAGARLKEESQKRHIKMEIEGDDWNVKVGKEDLDSLCMNLMENAVRYNHEGGSVKVKLDKDKKELAVSDTGIGIAKEEQERIFERFYRVDKAKSKKLGGTGLGLSIVKHICLDYGLTISIDSELGQGSTFLVKF